MRACNKVDNAPLGPAHVAKHKLVLTTWSAQLLAALKISQIDKAIKGMKSQTKCCSQHVATSFALSSTSFKHGHARRFLHNCVPLTFLPIYLTYI